MGAAVILAIDAGTTGVTAILFDAELMAMGRFYREFPQHFPQPGWVEHDAGELLGALDLVVREALAQPSARDVCAIGLTNQRETVFAVERGSSAAVGPGIVWQDRRTRDRCDELQRAGNSQLVQQKTGLLLDPYFSATKIEWMLRQDDSLRAKAQAGAIVFCTVDALVIAHLSGGTRFVTDPTNAARTMLFDLDTRAYDLELCELFGVDSAWLPDVQSSRSHFAQTVPERTGGRSLPILGVAGDQQAALFGQGCFDAGDLKATFGTGSFLLLNTGKERANSSAGLVTTLALGRGGESCFALEGSVFVCGAAIQFLRDQLGFIEQASDVEQLARGVEDCGGVTFVPAFTGLGAPYWDADARGAILGLTRGSSKAHIARAALEAMALSNAELIELLRQESGLALPHLLVDGGASANGLLMQMQADLAGATVRRPPDVEATARGAALLAGLEAGIFTDPAVLRGMGRDTAGQAEKFSPCLSPSLRRKRLHEWQKAVQRVRTNS